ncbi:MAG: hypothetical protein WCR72_14335, partial [Bacteroidota bacterium]
MNTYNNSVVISAAEIIGNICTAANYRNLTQRGHLKVVQRGCRNTPALIDYDSMPERLKRLVIERIGDPTKVIKTSYITNAVTHDTEARDFFNHYLTSNDEHLPANRITEYIANAEVLNALGDLATSKRNKR